MAEETETKTRSRGDAPDAGADAFAATELAGTEDAGSGARVPRSAAPRTVGRFRIDTTLGAGGMGDVYRAHDPVLDRAVALKVLRTHPSADDAQRLRRVVREARAAAALTHANTVTIFEVGEAENEVFIAMELLEGEDLRAVLERGDASLEDKLRWLLQAARALSAAHERGLVHRDVKPENMFVCRDGTLKLLDFGIAKRDDDEGLGASAGPAATAAPFEDGIGPSSLRTEVGRVLGTPRYMAPEQHASQATDSRTDQYAWGLVAFELLTGAHVGVDLATVTRPGGAGEPAEPVGEARLALLRERVPELPEALAVVIGRALEPRKEDRFPSMTPIVEALEISVGGAISGSASGRGSPSGRGSASTRGPDPTAVTADEPRAVAAAPASIERPRGARGMRYAAVGIGIALAALGMTAGLRLRAARAPAVVVLPPVCKVASTHTVAAGMNDRVAVLPDGAVVVAREIHSGLAIQRETPAGMVPFMKTPLLDVIGKDFEQLIFNGSSFDGQPALVINLDQGETRGEMVVAFTASGRWASQRLPAPVSGSATASTKDSLVIVSTADDRVIEGGTPPAVRAFRVAGARPVSAHIEDAVATRPSVAASGDRIALAYLRPVQNDVRFALLDADLQRIGDILTVASTNSVPTVAFAGATPMVLWMDQTNGKRRLASASLPPTAAAFAAPKLLSDDSLVDKAPVAVPMKSGTWAVAWLAVTGGVATLRMSPLTPSGELAGPTDVATGLPVTSGPAVRATPTDAGVDFYWHGADAVNIVRVACPR